MDADLIVTNVPYKQYTVQKFRVVRLFGDTIV